MSGVRVLFIGGSGIISSACSRLAVERGLELHVLNRGASTTRPLPPEATRHRADIRDPASLANALRGVRYLIHAAADYRLWSRSPSDSRWRSSFRIDRALPSK